MNVRCVVEPLSGDLEKVALSMKRKKPRENCGILVGKDYVWKVGEGEAWNWGDAYEATGCVDACGAGGGTIQPFRTWEAKESLA